MSETFTYRQQADAVQVTAMEMRDHAQILADKPVGKGGVDPAAIKIKLQRVEMLVQAAKTLSRVADKHDERESAA